LSWDAILQRLFSTFPAGLPGVGLLLLRLSLGTVLIGFGTASLFGKSPEPVAALQNFLALPGGIFLLAGLWTPVTSTFAALAEVWIAMSPGSSHMSQTWMHGFLAVVALSISMLGPGAWSVDARLFGRKRFDIDRIRGRKPSL
jgi:uncharacterized membrane protein YphA (DoxX/SURF4 family)